MRKTQGRILSKEQKRKIRERKEEEYVEPKTIMGVLKELPIVFIIIFLMFPVLFFIAGFIKFILDLFGGL